jgi:hypothetical protein
VLARAATRLHLQRAVLDARGEKADLEVADRGAVVQRRPGPSEGCAVRRRFDDFDPFDLGSISFTPGCERIRRLNGWTCAGGAADERPEKAGRMAGPHPNSFRPRTRIP